MGCAILRGAPEVRAQPESIMKRNRTRRQTERALLGSVLTKPEIFAAPELAALLAADFSVVGHREIWRAMRALYSAGKPILPADVEAEMKAAGAHDLAELAGLATAVSLESALAELVGEAAIARAIEDALAVRRMGENLELADQLHELADKAQVWPPARRSFFCEVFRELVATFCGPSLAGAH